MSPVLVKNPFIRPYINIGYGRDQPHGVKSLPDLIEFDSIYNPDHIFSIQTRSGGASDCKITFSQLQYAVEYASAWLVENECTTGRTRREQVIAPVGILLGSDVSIFIYMAALLRIGTPVLLLSARLTPIAIAHLLKQTAPSCVLIGSHMSRSSEEASDLVLSEGLRIPKFVEALGYEDLLGHIQGMVVPPKYISYEHEDLDAVIVHSSGTTGLPKPVYHSQTYVLIYAAAHRLPEQPEPFHSNISTLPLYHGFGLLAPALSLSIGMPFILPPASVIPTGKSTLTALQSSGARYMFSVPSIIEEIARLPGGEGLEVLKNLEIVAIGGAPMKEAVGSELTAAGVNLLNHWGNTELGAIAPIERVPQGYDWHYLMPRSDMGLKFIPLDDSSNTYRLVGNPPGWKEPFEVQDLLVANPHDKEQFMIVGRADDLLILSTGEKVRPTNLESAVSEHPDVKGVLAFGEGQIALGLLIELADTAVADPHRPESIDALVTSIQPYLERGNSLTDRHGKVANEMIIFTWETTKSFLRTDKGSLARKATLAAFEAQIQACYERVDISKAIPFPAAYEDGGRALLSAIRSLVHEITGYHDITDSIDMFEVGVDSLLASRLRRSIMNRLRKTPGLSHPVYALEREFCFENSSIEKMHRAITRIMSGNHTNDISRQTRESMRVSAMKHMLEKYRNELCGYSCLAAHARISRRGNSFIEQKNIILLTGSTGSLGCLLLARLANDPSVSKIICLNRRHSGPATPHDRQMKLMSKRGASMSFQAWEKIVLHGVEFSRCDFGLCEGEFAELLSVTHIIHNAWPVNFNWSLPSFEPHVKALSNLVRLSLLSSGRRSSGSPPTRLLFASSIAVAARFPILNSNGPFEVPETALDPGTTAGFGYSEAKWVCEQVLLAATELYGGVCSVEEPLIQGSNVRIGQMTGPEGSGAWNEFEHFPIIVRTAQQLGALPSLDGSLSWIPVNRAGEIIAELLFSKAFKPFYHLENPSRQSWSGVLQHIASILGGGSGPLPLIPLPDWLDRVRALGDDQSRNWAFKIINFLENDFQTITGGAVILRTSTTRSDSQTMIRSTAMDNKHLQEYMAYWKSVGLIQ